MKTDHMKKFIKELLLYFWIPLIVALVAYIFFELNDPTLGISVLLASSVVYAMARLYYMYKKWWLLLIMVIVVLGSVGIYFLRAPTAMLTINEQEITGTSVSLPEGTIMVNPAPQGNGQYMKNTVVTLTAEPASGYDWTGWTGTDNDNANPTTVTMDGDKEIKANFEVHYALIINNQQVIGSFVNFTEGSVTVNPPPLNTDGKYAHGTIVTLTVHANAGYDWQSWLGTDNDNANPTTVTMNSGRQITLTFSGRFELTINGQLVTGGIVIFPEGTISVYPAPNNDGNYAYGTQVTLQAFPNQGYGWQSWLGTSDYISNPTTVIINSDKHVTINWEQRFIAVINNQLLQTASVNFVGGTVTVNPAPESDGSYAKNTKVVFTAIPATGYRFGWWGGEVSGTSNSIIVTFNSDKSISVVFIKTYSLTTTVSPAQGGSISPASGTYDEGARVTLTATPATGYRFDHWEGAASGNVTSTTLTMNADKDVIAVFIKTYRLTVTLNPTEGGSVSPGSGTYDVGAEVTLTATPATGYRFGHWEGDATGTNTTITITMGANKTVTAVFIKTYTLAVTINPTDGGSVSPGSGTYDVGAEVTLTATAAAGYIFDHWEGAASGTNATIIVIMNGNTTITAVFIASP